VFQTRLLRMAPPGAEAVTGAIGVTVLNLGIAAGAALGGLVLDRRGAAALPVVAAALIAVAAVELLVVGRSRRPESW
jgi:predicted MFS family arabinose efflux permease